MTGTFDARVVKKTESKSGLFLLLELAGDDYYGSISEMPPGTLLKLQYEELDGNTGAQRQASERELPKGDVRVIATQTAAQQGGEETAALARVAQLESLDHTSQSRDVGTKPTAGSKAHRKFSDLPLSQQCAIICAEPAFKIFLEQMYTDGDEIGIVANAVRNLCGVSSRSQLNNGDDPATRWHNLHAEYQSWLTTRSHGDLVR